MANESILIVDDNPTNLKLVRILLTLAGYEIKTALNAKEALKTLSSFQPEVILMDIQMPGMDGLELTRKIKQNPKFKNTIILALTAYAMKGDKEKAMDAGCDGYISKPIDTQKLPDIIAEYLQMSKTKEL